MIEVTCTTEQQVPVKATEPKNTRNKPVPLIGALRGKVVSGDGSVREGASQDEILLVAGTLPGVTEFLVEGDIDLGGKKKATIRESFRLTVIGAFEGTLGLVPSDPVEKGSTVR